MKKQWKLNKGWRRIPSEKSNTVDLVENHNVLNLFPLLRKLKKILKYNSTHFAKLLHISYSLHKCNHFLLTNLFNKGTSALRVQKQHRSTNVPGQVTLREHLKITWSNMTECLISQRKAYFGFSCIVLKICSAWGVNAEQARQSGTCQKATINQRK